MAKQLPVWRGCKEVTETPESPDWDFPAARTLCTRIFVGPYEKCLSTRPTKGKAMADLDAGLKVERSKVKKQPGGKGILTVWLEKETTALNVEDSDESEPQYEVDWPRLEKKIESHPRYVSGTGVDDFSGLPRAAFDYIAQYFAASDAGERQTVYSAIEDHATWADATKSKALELLEKKLKGQEKYALHYPVVTRTREARDLPSCGTAGKREDPPAASAPAALIDAYAWLKTSDRAVRSGTHGKWKHVESWTGADVVDTDLYEEA